MRTAASDTASSFSPEHLETKLKSHSLLDSMMPANRKIKLWDLYTSRYHEAYVKAEDETQTPFGKAFLRAYEREIEKRQDEAHDE
jgi:FHA domain-containing protein